MKRELSAFSYQLSAQKEEKKLNPPRGLIWLTALLLIAESVLAPAARAQMSAADFCQSSNPAKQSVAISITSSGGGEHLLVAAAANQVVQVCAFIFDLGGTNPTAQFDYGTQTSTACDTGTTHLTGAMSASKSSEGPLDVFTAPAGNQLCINLGGTSPTAVGVLTYVQK